MDGRVLEINRAELFCKEFGSNYLQIEPVHMHTARAMHSKAPPITVPSERSTVHVPPVHGARRVHVDERDSQIIRAKLFGE